MNKWQNPEHDLGYPLTRQQDLLAQSGQSNLRSFWFELPPSPNAQSLERKILSLMNAHQVLSTYFGKPAGFDVIRQQVQAPQLSFKFYNHTSGKTLTSNQIKKFELEAHQQFQLDEPHLLVWCWLTTDTLTVQLVAPMLMLDNYSAYSLYQQLLASEDSLATSSDDEIMQYPEYLTWITELQDDEDAEDAKQFWQTLSLGSMQNVRLSEQKQTNYSLATATNVKHEHVFMTMTEELQQKLSQVAVSLNCSSKDIVLTVWTVLLSKLSSLDEFKLDYYHDCRHDYEEFDKALGCFTQPLPVPFYQLFNTDLAGACQGFSQLFEEIVENQEYLVSLDQEANVYCHAGYAWHKQNSRNDMPCTVAPGYNELLLDYLEVEQGSGQFTLFYSNERYEQQAMERALAHFHRLLQAMLDAPQNKVYTLNALLPDEQSGKFIAQDTQLSINEEQINTTNVVESFKTQAKAYPDHVAIRAGEETITYAALDRLTDKYASVFQAMGAKPDTIIALCLPRTMECLVSLLSVLKSGAAYLPLDPEQPIARLQQIIDDAEPIILITELTKLAANQCCSLSQLNDEQAQQTLTDVDIKPHHLAYVLYTSGSTGVPKGVQVEHQQISHYSQSVIKQLNLPTQSNYGLISSLMADLGNTMLFPAWLTASCVHLLDKNEANDGAALATYMQTSPLDCLKIVPSHLEALLVSGNNILPNKVLVLGGENVQLSLIELLKSLSPDCKIFNHYGPTETTVGVMIGEVDLETANSNLSATIGTNHVLLLDENNQTVISGQCGELYITGPNVTRGYLNDTERTNQVYLELSDKNSAIEDARYYKTGDLAISHADGSVSVLGRNDQQIKIRGFRLDLNEIQRLLLGHKDIAQANLQTSGEGENKQLIAFVVLVKGAQLEQKTILTYLRALLPNYMVPTHIFEVLQFPLNKNGKVDRNELLALAELQQQQVIVEPSNELERILLTIWQDVLKQNKVCITADFFDIGGHSLAAIKVVASARKMLSMDLPTDLLFKYKSIVDIANYINTRNQASSNAVYNEERLICLNDKAKVSATNTDEPCLILMHSLAGHFRYHTNFIENIGEKQALFGLMPNLSLLSESANPDIEMICDDYIEQLLPLKNKPLSLVGWSLGGKQMMLMVKRMQSLGFNLTGVALIDFDPAQQLTLENNATQLINDLHEYLIAENIELAENMMTTLTQNLQGTYNEAMDALLSHPKTISLLGEDVSPQALKQRFMMRWNIKHMLYDTVMPTINIPLWLWHGTGHKSPASIWQQFCDLPVKSTFIDADHYEILNQAELTTELIKHIEEIKPLVIC